MSGFQTSFTLSFSGGMADDHQLDFYDAAQAMLGFQRSLALTTHLILNNEVITQAPSLKGARILMQPVQPGSLTVTAVILGGLYTAYKLGTAPKDTVVGHLVHSAYDYVVSEVLGFHVDFDSTLGKQIKQHNAVIDSNRLDSLIEKCEPALKDVHRPLVISESADKAVISSTSFAKPKAITSQFTHHSYEHIHYTRDRPKQERFEGSISGYNVNTYKGRMYVKKLNRPVPFELQGTARTPAHIGRLVDSLQKNAKNRRDYDANIQVTAWVAESRTGRIKKLFLTDVSTAAKGS
ncbi:hypothetical protein [Maricaulis sp.]|uniref:DUF7946 domain-containing protein n=1 Tax=Maricaulis sp. TaxID=1486257 RepID=UPI000C512598|nr:hypothetical protein [Maricaulis sp.]MAC89991.1 hypothetical protein [Maricaulis sp.]